MEKEKTQILLLNGPNLNMLGQREPSIYGKITLGEIEEKVREAARGRGYSILAKQSNHEGTLIDTIQEQQGQSCGIIINPGALTHYSYGLRDALSGSGLPIVEIHISNVHAREEFRHHSVIAPIVAGQIVGFGWAGYLLALTGLLDEIERRQFKG